MTELELLIFEGDAEEFIHPEQISDEDRYLLQLEMGNSSPSPEEILSQSEDFFFLVDFRLPN